MKNIMLDLETMGNRPTSAIISIGAVYFDEHSLGESFYEKISLESCLQAGLTVDASTILWWMHQSYDARKEFIGNSKEKSLWEVLDLFASFIKPGTCIWGNGSDFDNAILGNAYTQVSMKIPWQYRNNRCFRTIKNMFRDITVPDNPSIHNALEDAKWQARYLIAVFTRLRSISHAESVPSHSEPIEREAGIEESIATAAQSLIQYLGKKYHIVKTEDFLCPRTRALAYALGIDSLETRSDANAGD